MVGGSRTGGRRGRIVVVDHGRCEPRQLTIPGGEGKGSTMAVVTWQCTTRPSARVTACAFHQRFKLDGRLRVSTSASLDNRSLATVTATTTANTTANTTVTVAATTTLAVETPSTVCCGAVASTPWAIRSWAGIGCRRGLGNGSGTAITPAVDINTETDLRRLRLHGSLAGPTATGTGIGSGLTSGLTGNNIMEVERDDGCRWRHAAPRLTAKLVDRYTPGARHSHRHRRTRRVRPCCTPTSQHTPHSHRPSPSIQRRCVRQGASKRSCSGRAAMGGGLPAASAAVRAMRGDGATRSTRTGASMQASHRPFVSSKGAGVEVREGGAGRRCGGKSRLGSASQW